MSGRERMGWAIAWLGLAMLAGFIGSSSYLFMRYGVGLDGDNVRFEHPWAGLLMLGGALAWLARTWLQRYSKPRLRFSQGRALQLPPHSWRSRLADLPGALRAVAIALIAVGLMGPQSIHAHDKTELSGIEIILTLDMSRSMEGADIRPTRFRATKAVVDHFIQRRPNDRIGAVVFGRDAYTLMPLTTDRQALRSGLRDLKLDQIDAAGTAIGNAIGVGLNRLRHTDAKSKVIILLTDGESNAGNVSPSQAAELAEAMQVKIFPILMGVSDKAPVEKGRGLFGRKIWSQATYPVNPELLNEIAHRTGGKFFAVGDREALEQSFHEILDQLEKSEIEDAGKVYTELFSAFAIPALIFIFVELLVLLWLRRWP